MSIVKYMIYDIEIADLDFSTNEETEADCFNDYGLGKIFRPINGYVKLHPNTIDSDIRDFYKKLSPACTEKAFFVREAKLFQKIDDDQILDVVKYRDSICRDNDEEKTPRSTNMISYKSVYHFLNYKEITPLYDSGLPKTRNFFSGMYFYCKSNSGLIYGVF